MLRSRSAYQIQPAMVVARRWLSAANAAMEGSAAMDDATADATPPQALEINFGSRRHHLPLARHWNHHDFMYVDMKLVRVTARTFKHADLDTTVTLIPTLHYAHPNFWRSVDALCCQHESVLMEGRYSQAGTEVNTTTGPISTVPPRDVWDGKPKEFEDAEGWEPADIQGFWQPFSWGVKKSPNHTVIHAADLYDHESIPLWASVRHNVPVFGALSRDRHCLALLPSLRQQGYKTFAIPWGCGHMPVMAEALFRSGFEEVASSTFIAVDTIDGVHSQSLCQSYRWRLRRIGWYETWIMLGVWSVLLGVFLWWIQEFTVTCYTSQNQTTWE
jgi:hypothetical protein